MKKITIALDGPSGSGKSTVAKILSNRLNILYLDTGAMYRAVAVKTLDLNIETFDENKISEFINDIDLDIKYIDGTQPWVLAKDEARKEELASVMNHLAYVIFVASRLYHPVLVTASDKAFDQLGLPNESRGYENIHNKNLLDNLKINKAEALFPRLDANIEVEFINGLMGNNK